MENGSLNNNLPNTEIPISQVPVHPQNTSPNKSFPKKIVIILIGIILLLIIGLLTIDKLFFKLSKLAKQPATVSPTPTLYIPPDLLAVVGGQRRIYKSTVERVAKESYAQSAINKKVLKKVFDIITERAILDYEAKKRGISIPQQKSQTAYYEQLKYKIFPTQVFSVQAYTIGYWIPPYTDPQQPIYEQERATGSAALDEIEQRLKNGENAFAVSQLIYNKYSLLQPILSINGFILKSASGKLSSLEPRTYTYDKRNIGQPFYDTLFSLKSGDIKKNIWIDGSGGMVMQIISVNQGERITYNEWLEKKKKELVKYYPEAVQSL